MAFNALSMDQYLRELVDIFTLEGVEYVRFNGLHKHLSKYDTMIDEDLLIRTVSKLRASGIIKWRYALICPNCNERMWQIVPRKDLRELKICDNCQSIYIPEPGVSLVEIDLVLRLENGWPAC